MELIHPHISSLYFNYYTCQINFSVGSAKCFFRQMCRHTCCFTFAYFYNTTPYATFHISVVIVCFANNSFGSNQTTLSSMIMTGSNGLHSVGIYSYETKLTGENAFLVSLQQIMCDLSITIAYKHATNLRIWVRNKNTQRADKFWKTVFCALYVWINKPIIQFQIIELGLLPLTTFTSSFLTFSSSFSLNKLAYSVHCLL